MARAGTHRYTAGPTSLNIDQATYDLFREDRVLEATYTKIDPVVKVMFNHPEDFYDGPSDQRKPQLYGDYRIVYRSAKIPADPDYATGRTWLWPTNKNWRRACASRRRWEM